METRKIELLAFLIIGFALFFATTSDKLLFNNRQAKAAYSGQNFTNLEGVNDGITVNNTDDGIADAVPAASQVSNASSSPVVTVEPDNVNDEEANTEPEPDVLVDAEPITPAANAPVFNKIVYDAQSYLVNQDVTLTVALSESTQTDVERSYYIELYSNRPYGSYLVADNTLVIPAGQSLAEVSTKLKFDTPGELNALVRVYDVKGGTLLTEKKAEEVISVTYKLTSPDKLLGIDLVSVINNTSAPKIKAEGYSFAVRYYSTNAAKRIYRKEALAICNAGIQLVTIYQDGGNADTHFTYDSGYNECKNAIQQAIEIGQPITTPIYFSVDFNANEATIAPVYEYFKGINAAMNDFHNNDSKKRWWKIGGYGSYYVIKCLEEQQLVTYTWQTLAWSDGQHYNYNFYQDAHDKTIGGLNADTNFSNPEKGNDVGGFYVR